MTLFFASRAGTYLTIDSILAKLDSGLSKYAGNPVLPKGAGGAWDDAQVRDMRLLIDEDGLIVTQPDGLWAYYSGYPDLTLTGPLKVGLAKSVDGGVTWTRYASNPVASNAGTGWYQNHLGQPTVVKLDDGSYVGLFQGQDSSNDDSIGCLSSADGLTWVDEGQKITLASLTEGGTSFTQMGVPSMIRMASGTWLCLFEGLKAPGSPGLWRIFGATASDPTGAWTMLNGGEPILGPTGAGWESVGVANAQIIEVNPGTFAIIYNGWQTGWQLGFAYSTNLTSWTRYSGNPILSTGTSGAWDDLHIEGSFLFKEPGATSLRVLYNGFKASTFAAQVGYATT